MRAAGRGIAVIVAVGALSFASSAAAKTYEVTKRGDPTPGACKKKDCSLREAVIAANAHAGSDRVVLPKKKAYKLSIPNSDPVLGEDDGLTGDLDITEQLRVSHPGKGRAKVDANGVDRAFHVFENAPTTFKKLVVKGGEVPALATEGGGGIHSEGSDIALRRTLVRGNHTAENFGGGIDLDDVAGLTMVRSAIADNRSDSDSGGLEAGDAPITIERSKIVGNTSDGTGGGLYLDTQDEPVRIVESTIAGNRALAGSGGGFHASGPLTLDRSTVSGNTAEGVGGGLDSSDSGDTLTIVNSTITGNHATGDGGGVWSLADTAVNAITVARNTSSEDGGGLYYPSGGPGFEVENSLLALNQATGAGDDCFAEAADEFDSQGFNLLTDDADCDGFDATGDFVNSNPRLGQLKNNGGPTQTIALKKGSPAINKANKATAPKKDQRGKKRGKKPDIGAYERIKKKKHHH
jgi:Right handed beta helix region